MFANITADWWRHLGMQVFSALVIALLHLLAGYDWSALGPYAAIIPGLAGLATEAFNQALGVVPPAAQMKLLQQADQIAKAAPKAVGAFLMWAIVLGAGLSLGACNVTLPSVTTVTAETQQFVTDVQSTASKVCGFIPDALTIANLLALGNLTTAADIADAVCSAITPLTSMRYKGKRFTKLTAPSYKGVRVTGYYVR